MKSTSWLRKNFYVVTWVVNIVLLPMFLVCLATGLLMFPGLLGLLHIRARNVPMETIAFLHDWTGLAMGAGVVFHLFLHCRAAIQFVKSRLAPPRKHHHDHHHGNPVVMEKELV